MKLNRSAYLSLGLVSALVYSSCGSKKDAQPAAPPANVDVQVVSESPASYYMTFPGTITALNEVELMPQVSGYIVGIHFKDGQHVEKGQLLYSMDQQSYEAGVNQSQANVAVAKANLNKAQKDADRYTALDKKDAIAKQVLDHALADLESAKMQVRAAEANVTDVKTKLRYSSIVAPFSGTIGISLVKIGTSVNPGTTLLNTISTDNPIAVDFFMDQKELPKMNAILNGGSNPNDSTFSLLLADETEYNGYGKFSSIDRAVDAQTGSIRVRLAFDNKEKALRPGMSTTVRIFRKEGNTAIVIPHKAVTEQMGEYFVYTVTDSSTVTQSKIKLGATLDDRVVVTEGLQVGQKIVVDGLQRVKEGAKIQTGGSKPEQKQK